MNDDKLGAAIERGKRAEMLLADELVKSIFDELADNIQKTWLETKGSETDVRERCWGTMQMLLKFRAILQHVAADGRIAQGDVDRMIRIQE
jgi:hypothetical protein